MVNDFVSLGVGMAAAGQVGAQMGELFKGFAPTAPTSSTTQEQPKSAVTSCAKCGEPLPEGAKFCLNCGEKVAPTVPDGMVICPECGNTVVKGKFCPECGHKFISACPNCGKEVPIGAKFCLECGQKL